MQFVNPLFLYGLLAVAVPVIIHLFNFRRFRKVYFTNVDFIRELKQETQKQSRLKHLLVLFARMLAVAALVLAFARPFLPVGDHIIRPQEQNSVSIYVDNSFSMQAESDAGTQLQLALEKAREIAAVYKGSDRFQLLTNDFEGRHQRFVSREEFLELLEDVDFSPAVRDFPEVYTRQSDLQKQEPARVKASYILSDFQEHFMEASTPDADSAMDVYLIPVESVNTDNLYIDSCWFDSPVQQLNQSVTLSLRIRNESALNLEDIPVKLSINGKQKALASFGLGAYSSEILQLSFSLTEAGIQQGILSINDFPVTFDDLFYFSFYISPRIRVLSINENSPSFYLESLYAGDTAIRFENIAVDQLDFSKVQEVEFVILNGLQTFSSGLIQEAVRFLDAGGSILVFPPADADLEAYQAFLGEAGIENFSGPDTAQQKVGSINLAHELYKGVFDEVPDNMDLPVVYRHFVVRPGIRTRYEQLMNLQNGNVFLGLFPVNRGKLYLSAVSLTPSFSTFPKHSLFVPTLYKMAVLSLPPSDLFYVLGDDEVIRIESVRKSGDHVMKIKDETGTFEIIPEHRKLGHLEDLIIHDQVRQAGNYLLEYENQLLKGLSFNYSRDESDMRFHSLEALKAIIDGRQLSRVFLLDAGSRPFTKVLEEMSRGIQLWKWFVLAALLFLLVEVLLLRFMK